MTLNVCSEQKISSRKLSLFHFRSALKNIVNWNRAVVKQNLRSWKQRWNWNYMSDRTDKKWLDIVDSKTFKTLFIQRNLQLKLLFFDWILLLDANFQRKIFSFNILSNLTCLLGLTLTWSWSSWAFRSAAARRSESSDEPEPEKVRSLSVSLDLWNLRREKYW